MIAYAATGGHLAEEIFDSRERGHLGDAAAEDLFRRQPEGLGLAVVDAQVAELNGIEEGETDRCGAVDGLELGTLTLGLLLALLQGFGEGLAIVDVDVDAEPVENISSVI